jgi:hypothetical protein
MKKVFLLMVVSGLLVTLGFAQTPDGGSNANQANVKGCLAGSDGNYTVAEDGTSQILKITSSSVDLKSHLGHDVNLTGHKASGAASSGAADNSFTVTELNMISDHCAAAAVAPAATASPSSQTVIPPAAAATTPAATASAPTAGAATPAATASTPTADATAPPATATAPAADVSAPPATAGTPAAEATTPAATASPSSATVSTPAAEATTPAATVNPSSETVSPPAAHSAQPARRSARPRSVPAIETAAATVPAATASPSSDAIIPAAADTPTPAATANASSETVSPPAAAATAPAVTHKSGSLFLLIMVAVLVVVLGTLVPVFGRWRRRKMLERTGTPNLSFTKEESSDQNKPAPRKAA